MEVRLRRSPGKEGDWSGKFIMASTRYGGRRLVSLEQPPDVLAQDPDPKELNGRENEDHQGQGGPPR